MDRSDAPLVEGPVETGSDQLLARIEDGVGVIVLNRPEARNALSEALTPALRRTVARFAAADEVGAVVVTGAGSAFCAGGDVKGMARSRGALGGGPDGGPDGGAKPRDVEDAAADLRHRQRTLTGALVAMRKPTVAALPGPAAGAGLALALACDIRFAARSAFVSTGYARVGLTGDYGINWLLTRLVGAGRARELMFTADRVDAETCERYGLVNRVFDGDALMTETMAFARRLAAGPRAALAGIKDNLDRASSADFLTALDGEAEVLVRAARTADHREAVRAFVEKRSPRFGAKGEGAA